MAMELNYDAAVEVGFAEDLRHSDVAPLLDALADTPIFAVRSQRLASSGPAGGGPELGLVLTAVAAAGGIAFAKTFCEELSKDTYKAVRAAVIGVVRRLKARDPEEVRAIIPFTIRVGNVTIWIGGSLQEPESRSERWNDEWLLARLAEAQRIVEAEFDPAKDVPTVPDTEHDHWLKGTFEALGTISDPLVAGANGTPDKVVMNYLAAMKEVELWAKRQRLDSPGAWEPIKAKFAVVRERYCTPRALTAEMATAFGDPPEFDPDRTRVVEVRAIRRDRALVVTMETDAVNFFEPELANDPPSEGRYEYQLNLIHGEWRLNSRTLNDLDGEPRIRGLL